MQLTNIGSMNYNILACILKAGNVLKLKKGAEIGVLYGDTSEYLLKELPDLTLYSVDPYLEYNDYKEDRNQNSLSEYEQITRSKLARFGNRSEIMKMFSLDAAKLIPDESLDFVFIDANHDYEFVKEDINAWFPKVRRDGIVSGHDYKSFEGVTKAVDEFCLAKNIQGFYTPITSDVWFFVKP
jgi:predicted O-methyltransferase YrrM